MKYLKLFEQFAPYQFKNESNFKTNSINRQIILPKSSQTYKFPYQVKCGYLAKNCDELHAFQDTSGTNIGNMNLIVKEWLDYFYSNGFNPEVSDVDIVVKGFQVDWIVTIDNSKDGKSWLGFTSRGAGCNGDIEKRSIENFEEGKKNVQSKFTGCEIQEVKRHLHQDGGNSFQQIFFKYTDPKRPSKSENTKDEIILKSTSGNTTKEQLENLVNQIKTETKGKSIDLKSIEFNFNNKTFSYKLGPTKINSLSVVWDNVSKQSLDNRLTGTIKAQNQSMKVLQQGESVDGNTKIYWAILSF
jgi:hypothetical protein